MTIRQMIFGLLLFTCVADSEADAQSRVFRDRVSPVWLTSGDRFWYRNDLPENRREFIIVDTVIGTRNPAFDHQHVAASLTQLRDKPFESGRLPIDSLEYSDDEDSVLLIGREGRFRLNFSDGKLVEEMTAAPESGTQLFLPARPSSRTGDEIHLSFHNQLKIPVTLCWIDSSGTRREYGRLSPGDEHSQHTFAGHIWGLLDPAGELIGCLEADRDGDLIILDEQAVSRVKRVSEASGNTRGRRRSEARSRPAGVRAASPDNEYSVFVREHNLWLHKKSDDSEQAVTTDAYADNSFRRSAQRARSVSMNFSLDDYPDEMPDVRWSPDGTAFVAFQTTRIDERRVFYLESTPADQLQPKLQSYPYLKPGDTLPIVTPRLFRAEDGTEIPISCDLFPQAWSLEFQEWRADSSAFRLLFNQRGHQRLTLLEISAADGHVRHLVDERSPTFIHYSSEGKFFLRRLSDDQLLWASERSGWNHLYRCGEDTGGVLTAVTSGEWNVRRVEHVDPDNGIVWFYAVGIRPEQDPYHLHFCRVSLHGGDVQILTEGDGTHEITWSPDRRCFLDRYSRVDLPPITELRSADGAKRCTLEEADASEVIRDRGTLPQRFVAKGRDGVTDIWGIVHRPRQFDDQKKYPVIENIYAGPHDHHVPKAFRAGYGHQQRIADQGFLVVQIDGMGTAWRSKAFHDVCYQNLRDGGFPDRIAWMRELADRHPEVDLSRIGIYGGSAGGQNAMSALLWHGDFYKAAVADCGCHDNRMDKIWWNEQWMGIPEGDHYARNSNMENAELLQGHLMLVVGELDRNVDPASTMQVAAKLVRSGKDFDLLVVPGAGHGACETPWASQRRIQFFRRTLLSAQPEPVTTHLSN